MIKCDHVTCHACPNKEADTLRAQLAEERDAAEAIRAAIRAAGAQPGESYVDAVKRIAEERDDALLDANMAKNDCDEFARQLAAVTAERDAYKAALEAINAIRNHIIERQSVNWSAHIYPLVKALNDAGITSSPKGEK